MVAAGAWLIAAGAQAGEPAPFKECAAAEDACFVLVSLTIDGVTAYPLKDLAPLYADRLARPIRDEDLVRIAQAITDMYRADGYFLSRAVVPPQGPLRGHARLRVYEGYVSEVEVTGDAAPALESLLAGLIDLRPLKLSELDRRLTLATDMPGVRAHTTIEPVLDDPARHRLVVNAGLSRWTGSLSLDNRGTETVGPDQAYARVGLNSILRAGDQIAVAALTVPSDPGEFVQGELSYSAALPGGARVRAAGWVSRSRQDGTPLNNQVGTESQALHLRMAYPLARGRRHSLWASATFDARHVEQSYRNGGAYDDDLRVLRVGLQASRSGQAASSEGFIQVSRGLPVLGASRDRGFERSRFDADAEFWKVNAGASHYRDLGSRAGLYLSASGQWAPGALLLSEEFAPGGLPYGRAYNYAEISGDSGVAALAELRVGWDPKLPPLTFFQAYGFVDGAVVWNTRTAAWQRRADIASAGAGLRLTFRDRVTLRMEAAKPLEQAPWETGDRGWRGFVSLWAGF